MSARTRFCTLHSLVLFRASFSLWFQPTAVVLRNSETHAPIPRLWHQIQSRTIQQIRLPVLAIHVLIIYIYDDTEKK